MANENLDPRDINDLYRAFESADFVVRKRYRADLDSYPICDLPQWLQETFGDDFDKKDDDKNPIGDNVQFFKITKLVYDKKENVWDKLTTVYHTMSAQRDTAILMLIHSDGTTTDIYLGVADREFNEIKKADNEEEKRLKTHTKRIENKLDAFSQSFSSNFPGSSISKEVNKGGKKDLIKAITDNVTTISAVSGVASIRNDEAYDNEKFVQGIEKLIDAMRGKSYSAIFIADCKDNEEIEKLCADYEDIYSSLSPFAQSQQTIGKSEGQTDTDSFIKGVTDTTNSSVSDSVSHSHTLGTSSANTVGGSVTGTTGAEAGVVFAKTSASLSVSANYSHTWGKNKSDTDTSGTTKTSGTAKSLTEQNSVAKSLSESKSSSLQITVQNRAVKTLMERIDEQIKHLRACEAFGIYDFCAYFMAKEYAVATSAASIYDSLMRGEKSGTEVAAVNTWTNDGDYKNAENAIKYLRLFYHPLVAIPDLGKPASEQEEMDKTNDQPKSSVENADTEKTDPPQNGEQHQEDASAEKKMQGNTPVEDGEQPQGDTSKKEDKPEKYKILPVTPAAMISGREIAIQMGLPKKSVSGLPVTECAEFGRNVISLDNESVKGLHLGHIYHMQNDEDKTPVELDKDSLTMHTFITGSTGSGKSNTVYQMLSDLGDDVSFLVVEPAKGEYKSVLGGKASVYGTNPWETDLLRINPFSFPEGIHIYEHMDRLIEIFNVCWPMYAAMPAVLKDAVERAYIDAGWDLRTSRNKYSHKLFPNFSDVLRNIETVMDESQYSSDSKGDYKGALSTRVRSLTNGINSMIFTSNEIPNEKLFDKNVIVDISRVGSTETKSLIMGLLVLKLQEYRMCSGDMNAHLKHVTVLEEAHNLLKRTSTEQTSEGANLLGKSVEMLTNAIAEMRTYGEGFIIADQAPGLLDMAAIRNTNTKIILRLPEYSDRELVGRAIGLNDDQIAELARLKKGVAAVHQNDWTQPVLCHVDKFGRGKVFTRKGDPFPGDEIKGELISRFIAGNTDNLIEENKLDGKIITAGIPTKVKLLLWEYANLSDNDHDKNSEKRTLKAAQIAYELFSCGDVCRKASAADSEELSAIEKHLRLQLEGLSVENFNMIFSLVTYWYAHELKNSDLENVAARKVFEGRRTK